MKRIYNTLSRSLSVNFNRDRDNRNRSSQLESIAELSGKRVFRHSLFTKTLRATQYCQYQLFIVPVYTAITESVIPSVDRERQMNLMRLYMKTNRLLAFIGKNNLDSLRLSKDCVWSVDSLKNTV